MAERESFPETQIRRLRRAVAEGFAAPEFGTELALMLYRGELTRQQFDAGDACVRARHAAQQASEVKPLAAAQLESGLGGKPPDPDSQVGQKLARAAEDARRRFAEMDAAIKTCGLIARAAWERVAYDNEPGDYQSRMYVRFVCVALIKYAEMRSRARRSRARKVYPY